LARNRKKPSEKQKVNKSKLQRFHRLSDKLANLKKKLKREEDEIEKLQKELKKLKRTRENLEKRRKLKAKIKEHKKHIAQLKAQESKTHKLVKGLYTEIYKPAKRGELGKYWKQKLTRTFMKKLGLR